MSFPTSPIDGQSVTVNNIVYTYNASKNTWTRIPGFQLYGGASSASVNAASSYANSAFGTANAAFITANTGSGTATAAFLAANDAWNAANTAYTAGGVVAGGYANSAYGVANTALGTATAAFITANTGLGTADAGFVTANAASIYANAAFGTANAAFNKANNALPSTGGTISGDLSVSGNLFIQGTTTTVSSTNVTIDDTLLYIANNNPANLNEIGFVGHFTSGTYQHTGLVRDHADNKWKLFSNVAEPGQTTVSFTNAIYDTLKVGNLESDLLTIKGTDLQTFANDAYAQANTAINNAAGASNYANGAFVSSNTAQGIAQAAFNKANTLTNSITSGFTANSVIVSNTAGYLTTNSGLQFFSSNALLSVPGNIQGPGANTTIVAGSYNYSFDNVGVLTLPGTLAFPDGSIQSTAPGAISSYANAAFATANASGVYANAAFGSTNAVYILANVISTYANAAFGAANAGFGTANAAFIAANTAWGRANSAFGTTNAAFIAANTAQGTATAGFLAANTAQGTATASFLAANAAQGTATAGFLAANSASGIATSSFMQANGAFAQANIATGAVTSAFMQANGAFTQANTATGAVTSAFMQANGAFAKANSVGSDAIAAGSYANSAFSVANSGYNLASSASTAAIGADGKATAAFLQANGAFAQANTATGTATSSFLAANAAQGTATAGFLAANSAAATALVAWGTANAAFEKANTGVSTSTDQWARDKANTSYDTAVLAWTSANNAWAQANTGGGSGTDAWARDQANLALTQANTAWAAANAGGGGGSGTDAWARTQANSKAYVIEQGTAPSSSNTAGDFWINTNTGVTYQNFGTAETPIWAEFGPTSFTPNTEPGLIIGSSVYDNGVELLGYANLIFNSGNSASAYANAAFTRANNSLNVQSGGSITGRLNVAYSSTGTGYPLTISAANTQGGTGYSDFLKVTNTSGGATNPNKSFRLSNAGAVEIINSAYDATILSLSDTGGFSVPGPISVSGKKAVNGPAFSAYADNTSQTITSGSQQKVLFQTEEFDTDNCFSSSRFTPNVEGYYQLNAEVRLDGSSSTGEIMIVLYKNTSEHKRGTNQSGTSIATNFFAMQVSSLVYANGTTDYFEIKVQQSSGSTLSVTAVNNPAITWFNGAMVRGA